MCIPCGGLNDSLATIGKCFDLSFLDHSYKELLICDAYSDGLMGQLKNIFDIKHESNRESRLKIKRLAKIRPKITCQRIHICSYLELQTKLNSSRRNPPKRTDFPDTTNILDLSKWISENSIILDGLMTPISVGNRKCCPSLCPLILSLLLAS